MHAGIRTWSQIEINTEDKVKHKSQDEIIYYLQSIYNHSKDTQRRRIKYQSQLIKQNESPIQICIAILKKPKWEETKKVNGFHNTFSSRTWERYAYLWAAGQPGLYGKLQASWSHKQATTEAMEMEKLVNQSSFHKAGRRQSCCSVSSWDLYILIHRHQAGDMGEGGWKRQTGQTRTETLGLAWVFETLKPTH